MAGAELLDIGWLLTCTILVLLMQAGFTCLETGLVRAKNSINVAIKNVADFCVSSLIFWLAGFAIMFGTSVSSVFGADGFLLQLDGTFDKPDLWVVAFFFFQLAFCGTSTTIVSGAVAERMSFRGYLLTALILSALIYPLFGHWAWGGLLSGEPTGWLETRGFIDFAGSTVVHSIGGWVALAAILVIGPRLGRFGHKHSIEPHNMPMAALGMFLIWIGWFGFNGGSTLALNATVPLVLVDTLLAASAGGAAALFASWLRNDIPDAMECLNGMLAGLVAITASAHMVTFTDAVLIGAAGGLICHLAGLLLVHLKIDDAIGAVPVHLAAGIWGTLAVALFGDLSFFAGHDRWGQFVVQLEGVGAAGALAFGVSYPLLWCINRFRPLRVCARAEREGLNVSEHGASNALYELLGRMEEQSRRGDFSHRVPEEPFTEAGEIARRYNQVLKKFNAEVEGREAAMRQLSEARDTAELANASKSQFLANMSHELRTPLNAIIGFSELIDNELFGPIGSDQYKEYISDIHKSSTHLLSLINDILDLSKIEASKMELLEEEMDLSDAIDSCYRIMRQRADDAGITLAIDLPDGLPLIFADKRAIRQMLINLVSNAVKFTPEGGRVTLSAGIEADGRLAIGVADTGIGMARADIPQALEPFGQITSDQTIYSPEGTGLGLPLTNALARLHGGTLVILSKPGEGTVITIRLPVERIVGQAAAA